MEIDLDHIDRANNEILHWSVVVRGHRDRGTWRHGKKPQKEDFALYVGCGGCDQSEPNDAFDSPAALVDSSHVQIQKPHLEPFTATSYYPIIDPEDSILEFESKVLESCEAGHFSIRLKVLNPAAEPFFWAPVLGCPEFECEVPAFMNEFPGSLIEFPSFILMNQREHWNELYWSIWVSIAIGLAVLLLVFFYPASWCLIPRCRDDVNGWGPPRQTMFWTIYEARLEGADGPYVENYKPIKATRRLSPRGILYFLAMWSLLTSLINSIINVAFSMESLDPPHEVQGRGVGLYVGVVVFFGHLLPMTLVAIIWGVHAYTADSSWREFGYFGTKDSECCSPYCANYAYGGSPWWAHGGWSILELIAVGLAGFIWLGAGFYVFPVTVTLAALYRMLWWICGGRWWVLPGAYNPYGNSPLNDRMGIAVYQSDFDETPEPEPASQSTFTTEEASKDESMMAHYGTALPPLMIKK
ncbi:MAG: hypothetical protein CMM02_00765 [Rhodopirellula sp.]|nr:hypothetical protein [Rhodopirellula sp.]